MTNKKIKFAVLGYGHIGKRHAEMIRNNQDCELVAIIDNSQKNEDEKCSFFTNLSEYLGNSPEADVITIATPNGLHAEHAIQCLEAGKHIVLEKPIATTRADAEKIVEAAIKNQRHVFPVMQNRFSKPGIWLKQLIENNILGEIFLVQVSAYWNRDSRYYRNKSEWHGDKFLDGGTLFTQFSHFVDLLYWCFGDVTNITSRFADFNHQELTDFEDTGIVSFDFINGGIGSINYSTAVWNKNLESSITVIAQNGSVKISGQYMDQIEYCHIKDYTIPGELLSNQTGTNASCNHQYVIQNVADVLLRNASVAINVEDGLKVVDIIERMYAAGKQASCHRE